MAGAPAAADTEAEAEPEAATAGREPEGVSEPEAPPAVGGRTPELPAP